MRRTLVFGLTILILTAEASGDEAIPTVVAPCLSCHSANGSPLLADVPIIAGQQPAYLVNALTSYRAGDRAGGQAPVMQQFARPLSDREIEAAAHWFGEAK